MIRPSGNPITIEGFFLPPAIKVSSKKTIQYGPVRVQQAVLTANTVSEIMDRLIKAQSVYLSKQSTDDLLGIIDAAVERWLHPEDPVRKTAEEILPHVTGFSPAMIRLSLTRLFEGYRGKSLRKVLDQSLGDIRLLDAFRPSRGDPTRLLKAIGPRITTHVLSGNIPGLGAVDLIATLLVKSACLCKVSSDEPVLTSLFARTLAEIEPKLADCLAVIGWKGGSPESNEIEETAFGRSELITATGNDAAIAEIQKSLAARQQVSTRFIGYGHRISLGLVGREAVETPDQMTFTARQAALDVAMYDQHGCLSPHVFYVETGGSRSPRQFADQLGKELDRLQQELPRGPVETSVSAKLHQIRSLAEIRQANGEEITLSGSATGTLWTVIYEADPALILSPLYRTIRVKPVKNLFDVIPLLDSWRPHLQAVGVALPPKRRLELAEALGQAGVNRICLIGSMQRPPVGWSQDGRRFIADRVRWVELET